MFYFPSFLFFWSVTHLVQSSRIIGGKPAIEGQFPFQVSVQCLKVGVVTHLCGGVIYNHRTVITSGECCKKQIATCRPNPTWLKAGDLELNIDSGHEQQSMLEKQVLHPNFTAEGGLKNDICLMITSYSFDLDDSKFISNLTLGQDKDCLEGTNCSISGWGDSQLNYTYSNPLTYSDVTIFKTESCSSSSAMFEDDSVLCAGGSQGSSGKTDSGGPLACGSKLCGIVIQANEENFALYTRVSAFAEWIEENAEDAYLTTTPSPSTEPTPSSAQSFFKFDTAFISWTVLSLVLKLTSC